MHEAVIVIADLYLHSGELPAALAPEAGALPGLEYAARFGERARLAAGWRRWLAHWLGRDDLAGLSVAAVAAAAARGGSAVGAEATRWMATPVELVAGFTRVHLDRRGLVRLAQEEQVALADAFHRSFAGSGLALQPLSDGRFLAVTPGIAAVATTEPARCAGGELVVPHGPSAGPLLRLLAEIEMWLHGAALNQARAARGAAPVTGLWLWGAAGDPLAATPERSATAANGGRHGTTAAFGADAFVAGLLHLDGGALQPLPERTEAVFGGLGAERTLVVVELGGELPGDVPWSLGDAAAALDRRLVRPALRSLADGSLRRLTLIANDSRVAVGRRSGMRRWRRPRAGLAAFA